MRLGFTQTLSSVLVHADEQARQLGQEFVGTEHLLLGILAGKTGDAFKLIHAEADSGELLANLLKALPRAEQAPRITGRLPISPKAQRAINSAMAQAQAAGQNTVSTKYLLLALLDEPGSTIGDVLNASGLDLDELKAQLGRPTGNGES